MHQASVDGAFHDARGAVVFDVRQGRQQVTLLSECLDEFIVENNTARIVDAFIEELDLVTLGFDGAKTAAIGRPS